MCIPLFNHLKELYSHPKLKGFRRAKSRWIPNHHHHRLYRSTLPYNLAASISTNKYINQILAFIAGWVLSDLKYTVYVGLSGTTLAFLAVVPPWPMYNRNPLVWASVMDPEGKAETKKDKWRGRSRRRIYLAGHQLRMIGCEHHGCWTVANMLPPSLVTQV